MTIAICDDEAPVRTLIRSYILKLSEEATILEYDSGEGMVASLCAFEDVPDVLFLDISFGSGSDGMEIAAQIRALYEKTGLTKSAALPVIIFVTGDEGRMPEAFWVHAFQYLVKPIDEKLFQDAFMEAQREVRAIQEAKRVPVKKLVVQQNGMSVSVSIKDILYVESVGRKLVLHLRGETVEYYGKISDAERMLGERFFRVHRAFLVNPDAVKKYSRTQIELTNGDMVPMARAKYPSFVGAYLRHIGSSV